uniref:Uncharacterized protein n=1 Tax=Cavia porcellus TaxID=10141 RepID=A0A286XTJ6_CAVPO
ESHFCIPVSALSPAP